MYVDGALVPRTAKINSRFIDELSMPQALLRSGPYDCRAQADKVNWERSTRLFNNTTKQDRYKAPPSVEKPRQNIWTSQLRCTDTPLSTHKTANGQRAWGNGEGAAACQLR